MIDEWGKGAKYWDHAWNPVIGCKPVSEGCEHCYAKEMVARFWDASYAAECWSGRLYHASQKPPRKGVVFFGNMTDITGEWNTNAQISEWIDQLSPDAVNLILTKRPENMLKIHGFPWVWAGITAENQQRLNERWPHLYNSHFEWRWLSLEPLLGPVDLVSPGIIYWIKYALVDWVVVGAESGPDRRPCKIEWVESIVEQCRNANVPVFVKQLHIGGKLVKDINKFPEHLQIRQVPWAKGGE